MPESRARPGLLADLGLTSYDEQAWSRAGARDPLLPRSDRELQELVAAVYPPRPTSGSPSGDAGCGECSTGRLMRALGDPSLESSTLTAVASHVASLVPALERARQTPHFELMWTEVSEDERDNIDESVVAETAAHLERAWHVLSDEFGRAPYVPSGRQRIEVQFRNIAYLGVASPPDGPIVFDAHRWAALPGVRRPSSAHELFHKLQYAFGYQREYLPAGDHRWFSEGTASWAEALVWNQVSDPTKQLGLYLAPELPLFASGYQSLPFWLFVQRSLARTGSPGALREFFTVYEATGSEHEALTQLSATRARCDLAELFAEFSRVRLQRGAVGPGLLDPEGQPLDPVIAGSVTPLRAGSSIVIQGALDRYAGNYHTFLLDPDTHGRRLRLRIVQGGASDPRFACYAGRGGRAFADCINIAGGPPLVDGSIDLAAFDTLVVAAISGDAGGAYELMAEISQ